MIRAKKARGPRPIPTDIGPNRRSSFISRVPRCSPSPHKSSTSHLSSIIFLLSPPIEDSPEHKSLSAKQTKKQKKKKTKNKSIDKRVRWWWFRTAVFAIGGKRARARVVAERAVGGETGGEGRAAHRRSISRGCQATNIHHQPTIPVPTPGARRRNRRLRRAPLRWRHLLRRRPIRATPAVPAAADSRAMHSTLAGSRLGAAAGPPPFRAADAPLASYRKSHASPPPSSYSSSPPPARARLSASRGREYRHLGSLPAAILPLVRLAAQPRTTPNK